MVLSLKKVLISDDIDPKCIEILQNNGIEVVKKTNLTKEQLISEIPIYDGLIVRSATKVTADVINAAANLKIIGRAGTGVDNIDCVAATRNGIIVMNTPGGNTLSAAEHTCTLIVSLSRQLGLAAQSMKAGKWDRKQFMGNELYGKTLAIIGLGRIGKEVAIRMQSFGMKTIGFDPIIGGDVSATFNTEWLTLDEIWKQADYITVHTPLIPQTKHLINDAVFAACKKGVRVVNCARGGIIDEAALLRALESGQCRGAGLDVFTEEPPTDYTLVKHPLVIATPHLGASTVEAQSRVAEEIAQQFVDVTQGRSLFGAINASALAKTLSPNIQPWVKLAQTLGSLTAVLAGKGSNSERKIQITSTGSILKDGKSYLSAAVLAGFMRKCADLAYTSSTLNLVNAPLLAQEAKIQVDVTHKDDLSVSCVDAVVVDMETSQGGLHLCGTVTGLVPVLVQVQETTFSVPPILQGPLLIFKARNNVSEVVPLVCAGLSEAGAVLTSLSISTTKNSSVWGVVNLTSPVANGLESVKKHVISVDQIVL
ncbi:D-3-phosphoglycerate dehydrogenase-like [Gigantopelta aegis]|uniref:D-3-phosphoglycerate dehydrogenase-like n=1 Tax=Gigantopelta aegis TaxID=1735272 RepID=UPI001B88C683|nr:D-3-phosphoglycerate dehydrogenase-like [Gigantopelta aegis]